MHDSKLLTCSIMPSNVSSISCWPSVNRHDTRERLIACLHYISLGAHSTLPYYIDIVVTCQVYILFEILEPRMIDMVS